MTLQIPTQKCFSGLQSEYSEEVIFLKGGIRLCVSSSIYIEKG